MKAIRYVTMNPTGNLTCLVLDEVPETERPGVTAALMGRCEQVGYLGPAAQAGNRACLRMMGGEFCGNATMAAAAWLCREKRLGPGQEETLFLEVSGAEAPVPCRIRATEDGAWEGTVRMPGGVDVSETEMEGERLILVRMEGILHLIREGAVLPKEKAESLLLRAAERWPDPALGLLQWEAARQWMTPLVFVRGSGTMVWETGCGSGSTAIGAWLARQKGDGITESAVHQPGGCIRVRAKFRNGRAEEITMTGRVTLQEDVRELV